MPDDAAAIPTHADARPRACCPTCRKSADRLHRVRVRWGQPWVAACALCAARLLERDAAVVYGGLVHRGSRRMRRRRAG
ncbi:MAG: hypothetical protein RIB60_02820 [Phycisphaerales bacterium]